MQHNHQDVLDGETLTVGPCRDPRWRGCFFASLGTVGDHTTWIVQASTGQIQAVSARGSDRGAWSLLAIALSSRR